MPRCGWWGDAAAAGISDQTTRHRTPWRWMHYNRPNMEDLWTKFSILLLKRMCSKFFIHTISRKFTQMEEEWMVSCRLLSGQSSGRISRKPKRRKEENKNTEINWNSLTKVFKVTHEESSSSPDPSILVSRKWSCTPQSQSELTVSGLLTFRGSFASSTD